MSIMVDFKSKYPNHYKKQHKKRIKSKSLQNLTSANIISGRGGLNHKIILQKNEILPKNFIVFLRKKYRKFFKKNKIKFYLKLNVNYMISCKNKNSRMGKGVGTLKRSAFFKKSNSVFIEVFNISPNKLDLILKDFKQRTNIDTFYF